MERDEFLAHAGVQLPDCLAHSLTTVLATMLKQPMSVDIEGKINNNNNNLLQLGCYPVAVLHKLARMGHGLHSSKLV